MRYFQRVSNMTAQVMEYLLASEPARCAGCHKNSGFQRRAGPPANNSVELALLWCGLETGTTKLGKKRKKSVFASFAARVTPCTIVTTVGFCYTSRFARGFSAPHGGGRRGRVWSLTNWEWGNKGDGPDPPACFLLFTCRGLITLHG